jgi:hypothetical protein
MESSSRANQREEQVPLVLPLSAVPRETSDRGGEIILLANRYGYEPVQLWQESSLNRAKQAHFLNGCPK